MLWEFGVSRCKLVCVCACLYTYIYGMDKQQGPTVAGNN